MNVFVERALKMVEKGYTVFPTRGKIPLVKEWQKLHHITPATIYEWEQQGLWSNIALLCGAASKNTVVIDFDGLAGYELFKKQFPALADTFTVKTGSGKGMHVYFTVDLLPDSTGVMNIPLEGGELINIEFKADGKPVIIPPSIHPDTLQEYQVANSAPVLHLSDLSKVLVWAKALKPQVWEPPKTKSQSTGKLNPQLLKAVENYFLASPHKMHNGWINCMCPNGSQHKNGDTTPSFGYNIEGFGNCFLCGDMNLKAILGHIGMKAEDYGGFYEKIEVPQGQSDYKFHQAAPSINGSGIQAIPVITRSSRLTTYINRMLDFETPVENPPVPFPLKVLHPFGGMARAVKPGKLIGIIGVSGGGKTSLLETCVDGLLAAHVPCLVWSPEWCADEFVERAVQRYGGVTSDDLYMHEIFKDEYQRGIKDGVGIELTQEQVKSATEAIRTLRGYTEEVGYLDMPMLTIGHLTAAMEKTLAEITFKPRVLIIDYVQLFHAMEINANLTMYNLLLRIKALCQQYNLVGIVASQVTKADAKEQSNGQFLDAMSGRFVNDDAFNLFLTINPDYDSFGNRLYSAVLSLVKNSMGKRGKIRTPVNWERLFFGDKKHPNQVFEGEPMK